MRKSILLLVATVLLLIAALPSAEAASQTPTYSLKGQVIVIDPGHGGSDTGAIGPKRLSEKEVTLKIALELRRLLTARGATVVLTRTDDRDVSYPGAPDKSELMARVNIANHLDADLFVSIHADAFISGDAQGTTTYFYGKTDADYRFAQSIQASLVNQTGLLNRGSLENDFFVLKRTAMPAVLAEVAFISNPQEEKLLQSALFCRRIAQGLYDGIANYLSAQ